MSTENAEKRSYKQTLNLPSTPFAMKANLVQREPQFQARWTRLDLYRRMIDPARPHPAGKFVLHDGPPYANGSIHLGHLLNKSLKDMAVRSRSMMGHLTPFVPGWDCHGLPIEHKVVKDLGPKARQMSVQQVRELCQKDAAKFVKLQATQMQRLGTVGDYDDPYLTMKSTYEAAALEVFADLVGKGLVYRALKPVHWSIENRTALAEAELEYEDREDTSVYVLLQVVNPEALPDSLQARPGLPINLMIWTTTPWTLPANMAVAVSPSADYAMYQFERNGNEAMVILAADLARRVLDREGSSHTLVGMCSGAELEAAGVRYAHPFIERTSPVVTAEYVTLEDGTGMVHTAPGHGVEDYQTGLRSRLRFDSGHNVVLGQGTEPPDVYCPVKADGTFDDTAPEFLRPAGEFVNVWKANDLVVEKLRESDHLFHADRFTHSYPHDWRSKTPVIFRATEQWFIGVDKPLAASRSSLREQALEVTRDAVRFLPEWGRNRMRGMLESRPDWCVSRQRAWGLPIPALFGPNPGEVLLTKRSTLAIAQLIREKGSDIWFSATPHELLQYYNPAEDPDAPAWAHSAIRNPQSAIERGSDIFDVWFDSGCSWHAVLEQRGIGYPPEAEKPTADLYLEGSDQHRGWFQVSLLPSLGVNGKPPFATVLTHGFIVDRHGRKMSKSLGNTIEVEALLKDFGADVCRWWVASLNTDNDIKADLDYFKLAGEEYRKVRNTIRFLLANLSDFDPAKDDRPLTAADAHSIDAWAIGELNRLIRTVRGAYEKFEFSRAQRAIFDFCNDPMSAVYLSATKDRLYCDAKDSPRRRRTQTAMRTIVSGLIRLVAPILVHTADEAWLALHGLGMDAEDCVQLAGLPEPGAQPIAADEWARVMEAREGWMKVIEESRQRLGIENPMDMGLRVPASGLLEKFDAQDLVDLVGVSRITFAKDAASVEPWDLRSELRCERSWRRDGTVKKRSDGGDLSDRDAAVLGV